MTHKELMSLVGVVPYWSTMKSVIQPKSTSALDILTKLNPMDTAQILEIATTRSHEEETSNILKVLAVGGGELLLNTFYNVRHGDEEVVAKARHAILNSDIEEITALSTAPCNKKSLRLDTSASERLAESIKSILMKSK